MDTQYILVDRVPVLVPSMEWAKWIEGGNDNRRVCLDHFKKENGHYSVSTVFLGLDHNFGDGPPILFETMIFGHGELCDYQDRYCTWDEAVSGHLTAVKLILDEANSKQDDVLMEEVKNKFPQL